jgi:hypothetical protein
MKPGTPEPPQTAETRQQVLVDHLVVRLRALADYAEGGPSSPMLTDMIALMREAAKELDARAALRQPETIDPADAKQANGDTYRRILGSWQEYDACLRKISAVCWTDNDPMSERDCAANIIRHIRDLQRRVRQAETPRAPSAVSRPAVEQESGKPRSMEFFNSKFAGFGAGKAGDCRVVVRTERKGMGRRFIQIIDDSDGVGLGFTLREAEALIAALQSAIRAEQE